MVEHQTRDLEVRGLNPGPDSNFSLEFKLNLKRNTCNQLKKVHMQIPENVQQQNKGGLMALFDYIV